MATTCSACNGTGQQPIQARVTVGIGRDGRPVYAAHLRPLPDPRDKPRRPLACDVCKGSGEEPESGDGARLPDDPFHPLWNGEPAAEVSTEQALREAFDRLASEDNLVIERKSDVTPTGSLRLVIVPRED